MLIKQYSIVWIAFSRAPIPSTWPPSNLGHQSSSPSHHLLKPKHNLQLAKGGKKVMAGPHEPLVDYLHRLGYSSSHLIPALTLHNIYTVSDVFSRQLSRWSPAIKHILQTAAPAAPLPDLPDTLSPTGIRIGQLWHTNSSSLEEAC